METSLRCSVCLYVPSAAQEPSRHLAAFKACSQRLHQHIMTSATLDLTIGPHRQTTLILVNPATCERQGVGQLNASCNVLAAASARQLALQAWNMLSAMI